MQLHAERNRVLQAFLFSGTRVSRLKLFRSLIKRGDHFSLSDESHMAATYIPRIEERENWTT